MSQNTYIRSGEWVIISSIKEKVLKYLKSLRARIFIIVILVGLIPIFLMKYVILENYENQSIIQKSSLIQSQCQQIIDQVASSGYVQDVSSNPQVDKQLVQLANIYSGRVIIVNSNFRIVRDTYEIDEDKVIISEEVLQCFLGTDSTNYNKENEFLELTLPIKNPKTKDTDGIMIVSLSTQDVKDGKDALSNTVLILQWVLTIMILAAAFYLARMLTKPFGKITRSLEEVRGGVTEQEISIPDYTETKLLSEAYNRMLNRMKIQEDSRQEFVSNVSHELKTPITSMKVLADSLLAQDDVPVELYKEFMGDIAEEIDRENKIITDLLSLVKMDKKSADINIQETNINQLIELILKRLRPIAAKKNVELVLESFKPILAEVDETKLTLALSNLIENGIKYNQENGWVHVSLNIDSKYFYVKVEDSGMGIPEEDQEHIFERFYRVDKSHSREIGGTGLGLAITRSAVLMHHGAIKVYSKEGEGTTFTVRIPLKYVP
ncbi:MAG: cell wall metabolism sensor histidine kinase WalK [Lachnospiraceae bacterium]|nr:cell wall metabolism sensor histidine kinase WalK [Lachnospiraceae bacterium]MDD7076577.1 HAMP domain-containing sensor histidine kinase [Lachnospiraceae bacterium]MDY3729223.1 HAMP domain-containing sensor histidine kinase [Candidatus Choladocola sp.]